MATPFGGGRAGGRGPRLEAVPGGGGRDREVAAEPGIVGTGGNELRGGGTGSEDLGGTDGGGSIPA
jgi:hypothetical protein